MQLEGRVAIVTGAGSGIGKGAAILLARQGARIACVGREEKKLRDVVAEIGGNGGEAIALAADVSDPAAMQHLFEQIDKRAESLLQG